MSNLEEKSLVEIDILYIWLIIIALACLIVCYVMVCPPTMIICYT